MPAPTVLLLVQLQEEKDPHHWGVDTGAIHHAMNECGIDFIRTEVRPCAVSDFADHTGHSLVQAQLASVATVSRDMTVWDLMRTSSV